MSVWRTGSGRAQSNIYSSSAGGNRCKALINRLKAFLLLSGHEHVQRAVTKLPSSATSASWSRHGCLHRAQVASAVSTYLPVVAERTVLERASDNDATHLPCHCDCAAASAGSRHGCVVRALQPRGTCMKLRQGGLTSRAAARRSSRGFAPCTCKLTRPPKSPLVRTRLLSDASDHGISRRLFPRLHGLC